MKYGTSLEEVWEWREKLSHDLEGNSPYEQMRQIHEQAQAACVKYGLRYKVRDEKKEKVRV
jgi:hypothetical protein